MNDTLENILGKPTIKRQCVIYMNGVQDVEHERIIVIPEETYQQIKKLYETKNRICK